MIEDIQAFIDKYKFNTEPFDEEKLNFRLNLLSEEYNETLEAYERGDAEELVDGLIDIVVIAIGTLELAGVDVEQAWEEVMRANMSKVRGVKPGREESNGFDVLKPEGWISPSHQSNHGVLDEIL